ncbi:unnamed protein product [marine sediment metagenome]|uniref:DUF1353 domain-containing protein n=1 Tax=marine sediment metagenome TaxID=412755 RepID=X0Y835_9ZZZZ
MIKYRSLHAYKYQIMEDYEFQLDVTKCGPLNLDALGDAFFLCLLADGMLMVMEGYAYDGPSGPTIDTENSMRASLVHDALYQLMRLGVLPQSAKKHADQLLYDLCVEDGMSKFRAYYWWLGVKYFGIWASRCEVKDE